MKKHICLAGILTLIFSSHLKAQSQYPAGSVFGSSGPTAIVDVKNPKTGRTWMDRNLGATRAATSSTDAASYGDLYQWGRRADGHQLRTSATTATSSSTDKPAHGMFILSPNKGDWHSPQNPNLWKGVNGVNNPCPRGYRLPTKDEWDAERVSWSTDDAKGAFSSPLKLPMAGSRGYSNGSPDYVGSNGRYWSSTVSGTNSRTLDFSSSDAIIYTNNRAEGSPVRCIKD